MTMMVGVGECVAAGEAAAYLASQQKQRSTQRSRHQIRSTVVLGLLQTPCVPQQGGANVARADLAPVVVSIVERIRD